MRRLLTAEAFNWIAILAFIVVAVVSCNTAAPPEITQDSVAYWHDDEHGVSCWLYGRGGGGYTAAISCLPDAQVTNP